MIVRLALRHLVPRQFSVISIITVSSVLGIVIGTAALIIVMSIFNGFRNVARDLMVGFGPHVRIIPAEGTALQDVERLEGIVGSTLPGVTTMAVMESRLVIQSRGITSVMTGVGLKAGDAARASGLQHSVVVGTFMTTPYDNTPSIVLAAGLADKLQAFIGDTVTLLSPEMIEQALMTMARPNGRRAVVRGIFQSNSTRDIDYTYAYTDVSVIRALTRRTAPTAIDITMARHDRAAEYAARLQTTMASHGLAVKVLSWEDINRGLYDTMKLERLGSFIVLALIVLVAAFNVLVSLTLSVVDKRRDIAILKSIGATDIMIQRTYLLQGLLIGVVSVAAGTAIGIGVCLGQIHYGWISFDPAAGYLIPALPVDVHAADVIVTVATGLVLACCASIYPARRAYRSSIVDGIRVS